MLRIPLPRGRSRLFAAVAISSVVALLALASDGTATAASSPPGPPFTQCPAVGASPSCKILLVVEPTGAVSVHDDTAVGDYDGADDTLVGIVNTSGQPVTAVTVKGAATDIGGFDGDGLCTYLTCTYPAPTGYEGPANTFTTDPANLDQAEVDFTGSGLAAGASTYFSLEGTLTAAEITARKGKLGYSYVAIGDSFSSGEGVPAFDHTNDSPNPDACHRSTAAYAKVLAADPSTAITSLDFWACSGATRKDMFLGASSNKEGPQLARVGSQTNLVTLSVGGNDIGFADVVTHCTIGPFPAHRDGSADCQNKPVRDPDTGRLVKLSTLEDKLIANLGSDSNTLCFTPGGYVTCSPALHNLYGYIVGRSAPGVKIRVMLYPHLFKTNPERRGCTLLGAAGLNFTGTTATISQRNMQWINAGVDKIDSKIMAEVKIAHDAGYDVAAVDPRPAFDDNAGGASPGGHGVCSAKPWFNGLILDGAHPSPYSFHPNKTGQVAFAAAMKPTLT